MHFFTISLLTNLAKLIHVLPTPTMVVLMADSENGFRQWLEAKNEEVPPTDVQIVTSGKRRISAHSSVLAYSSPVLESMLGDRPKKRRNSERVIRILGVPYDAVQAFICFLYSGESCNERKNNEEMKKYSMHLLVLSHVYQVGWLKRACERALAGPLAAENAVDILVLARRCDAPWLYLRCMKLLAKEFAAVEKTEAWKFLQENDPFLELEILQSLQDTHLMERRRRRKREEQKVYVELSEAMECLGHICTEGCTHVGPCGRGHGHRPRNPAACPNAATCYGLQQLMRHFFDCNRKTKQYNCNKCKRLWQLLRLHASICDCDDNCKVPLCMQFKEKMQLEDKVDNKWMMLVKKVRSARVVSYLAKRKRQDEVIQEACLGYLRL